MKEKPAESSCLFSQLRYLFCFVSSKESRKWKLKFVAFYEFIFAGENLDDQV